MKYRPQINQIQASIMRQLFLHDTLRFAEINIDAIPSDQFSYHLRQLTKQKLIEKGEDNTYRLSVAGRSRAIMLDAKTDNYIEQGFVACRVVLSRHEGDETEYLIQERTKVPYKGFLAEPGGKILFGEDISAAAKRNMLFETELDCDIEPRGMVHYKDLYQDAVVQDKYFFVFKATNPQGTLLPSGSTGKNMWLTLANINASPKVHQGVLEIIEIADSNEFRLAEHTFIVDGY